MLDAVARVADARGIRWYLFGAQAVGVYGVIRTSADVDVTAEIPPQDVRAFVRDMVAAGFTARVRELDAFLAETPVIPFVHESTGWPLDVVLAGPGLDSIVSPASSMRTTERIVRPVR